MTQGVNVEVNKLSGAVHLSYRTAAIFLTKEQARSLVIVLALKLGMKVTE